MIEDSVDKIMDSGAGDNNASSMFNQSSGFDVFADPDGSSMGEQHDFSDFAFEVDASEEEKQDFPEFQRIPNNTWVDVKIQTFSVVPTPYGNKDRGKPQIKLELDLTVAMKETYGNRTRPMMTWVPMYVPRDRSGGTIYPFKSLMQAAGLEKEYNKAKKEGKLPDVSGLQDTVLQVQVYQHKAKALNDKGEPFINERVSTSAGFLAKGAMPPASKKQDNPFKGS